MSVLDNRAHSKQLDPNNYLSHIFEAPEQLVDGFDIVHDLAIPALYAQAKQIVLLVSSDMLPVARSLEALMLPYARVPLTIITDYTLPFWVSKEALVIALDYSGTTEQVLVTFREASKRTNRLLAVSVDGDLAREARRVRAPHIALHYGSPARVAFYYIFSAMAHLFKRLDLIELRETTVSEASVLCRSLLQNIGPDVAQYQNNAKQLAEKVLNRRVVIVGSGPLIGMAKKWELTFATAGKTVVIASTLGEFNDTIINGMKPPPRATELPLVIMLQSKYDHPRNKLQQTLTYQVVQAQKILYEQIFMHPSGSLFGEIVLSSLLGDMVSYYLAMLKNIDPTVIEATSYIREHLPVETLFNS